MLLGEKRKRNSIASPSPISSSAPVNGPTVYYVILSHGGYDIDDNPIYLEVPDGIENFNKITYAPFGMENSLSDQYAYADKHIVNTLKKSLTISQPYGDELLEELRLLQLMDTPSSILNKFPKNGSPGRSKDRTLLHLLNRNSSDLYQGFVYRRSDTNQIPIIDKIYETDDRYTYMNIHVVYQHGGELIVGEEILKNIVKEAITTKELLELSALKGYETVVMIDFSCDCCIDFKNKRPTPRNVVLRCRDAIRNKTVGRGGKGGRRKRRTRVRK